MEVLGRVPSDLHVVAGRPIERQLRLLLRVGYALLDSPDLAQGEDPISDLDVVHQAPEDAAAGLIITGAGNHPEVAKGDIATGFNYPAEVIVRPVQRCRVLRVAEVILHLLGDRLSSRR